MAGQSADGAQQEVRLSGADAYCRRERAEHSDRADAGAARHLDIFGGVAHVDAFFGLGSKALHR